MIRAIFFDAAGTLFRVRGSVGAAYAAVAALHGVRVDAVRIEERFRSAFRGMPPMCFPGIAETQLAQRERAWWRQVVMTAFTECRFRDFEVFFNDLFEHFAQPAAWELFADVAPTLSGLQARGLQLAVVSNFDGRLTRVCDGLGIRRLFAAIVMSGRAGCAKPDPRIFAVALERLGVAASQAIHVGDSEAEDLEGARAAGVSAILIRRDAPAAECSGRIRDLRELLHHVQPLRADH